MNQTQRHAGNLDHTLPHQVGQITQPAPPQPHIPPMVRPSVVMAPILQYRPRRRVIPRWALGLAGLCAVVFACLGGIALLLILGSAGSPAAAVYVSPVPPINTPEPLPTATPPPMPTPTEEPRTVHVVRQGEELSVIAKKYNVSIDAIVALNTLSDPDLIQVGQRLVIPAAGVWQPDATTAPSAPLANGKSILVSVASQRIYAYEDGHFVRSTLVSTGRIGTDTVLGDYRIYAKHPVTRMRGPGYDLPNVPYVMYFFEGYGIHGTYWHNNFGRRMSHGCVNLELTDAEWFYHFAPIGTLVRVVAS